MALVKEVYLVASELPNEEKFGLSSQIRRCAVSIPSNIAEGAGGNNKNEFLPISWNCVCINLRIAD